MKLGQTVKRSGRYGAKLAGKGLRIGAKIAVAAAVGYGLHEHDRKQGGIQARKLRREGIVEDAEVGRDQNSGFPADSWGGDFSDDDMHEGFG
jgi:hypothetical protein